MIRSKISLVYQITQQCVFNCEICHRRYVKDEGELTFSDKITMVEILKQYGLKRLTITGGEPMLLGKELFDFLVYLNQQHIHTCLSTTGYQLDNQLFNEMDNYLDQLHLPIRSLDPETWKVDFGSEKSLETLESVKKLLEWAKNIGIIISVSTVLHRKNIGYVYALGRQLVELNPNIIWCIDEYYPMGKEEGHRSQYDLETGLFEKVCSNIEQSFRTSFKGMYFNSATSRKYAPDYLITPHGDLVTTDHNRFSELKQNIFKDYSIEFKNRWGWDHYSMLCRNWGWDDFIP